MELKIRINLIESPFDEKSKISVYFPVYYVSGVSNFDANLVNLLI